MASSTINSWQVDGETMEIRRDYIFLASKITEDGDYSHEIKKKKNKKQKQKNAYFLEDKLWPI